MAYRLQWEQRFDHPVRFVELDRGGHAVLIVFENNRAVILNNSGHKAWEHTFRQDVTLCHISDGGSPALFYCGREMFLVDPERNKAKGIKATFSADALTLRPRTSLIVLGNRYGLYRQFLTNGKIIARGDLGHGIEFLRFSPDASFLVAADAGGRTTLMESSGEECWTVPLNDTIRAVDIAEDACRVAAVGTKSIYLIDREGITVDELGMGVQPVGIAVQPEGGELTFATKKGSLHRIKADGSHIDAADFGADTMIRTDATGLHVGAVKLDGKGTLLQFFAEESAARPTRIARPARGDRDTIDGRGEAVDYIELD